MNTCDVLSSYHYARVSAKAALAVAVAAALSTLSVPIGANQCKDQCKKDVDGCKSWCGEQAGRCESDCEPPYNASMYECYWTHWSCMNGAQDEEARNLCDAEKRSCDGAAENAFGSCKGGCNDDKWICNSSCDVDFNICMDSCETS